MTTNKQQQQQQQCIYLKKYQVYNTSCPANSYNANLGRTRLSIKALLNYIRKEEIQKHTERNTLHIGKFKYKGFCYLKKTKITTGGIIINIQIIIFIT